MNKSEFFTPERANLSLRQEHISPSGKYRLQVTPFKTGENSWSYTQGLIFMVGSETPIAEIQRNYSSFPFCWVENHPNGHDYLIGGEDYQEQTVIELDTGKRVDSKSDLTAKGIGFCWAEMEFDIGTQMLIVCGCVWADPFEYRFYDFSDPMKGWTELESDICIYDDGDEGKKPWIELDGTIRCYQTEKYDDEELDIPAEDRVVSSILSFKREGDKLVLVDEFISDKEKLRRAENKRRTEEYERWIENFRNTDPLYLTMIECLKDPVFSPRESDGIGQTYRGWCPWFEGNEPRMSRRIVTRAEGQPNWHTIDLEWGIETGPIKLVIYHNGKQFGDKFFDHSVEGMHEAFAYAKKVVP